MEAEFCEPFSYKLRVNGRGNAWPVALGQEHPMYSASKPVDYANASFSVFCFNKGHQTNKAIQWEYLIDAGHGCIPLLLNSFNRIPEALILTHPHFDHILGIDWVAQSFYRFSAKKKYPVYATPDCWDMVLTTIPHLAQIVEFMPLYFGRTVQVVGTDQVRLTAFPVYHGTSALGAAMLLFEILAETNKTIRILFTGDLLCPLLRPYDYNQLYGIDVLICDSNNRYPYPKSNHWSLTDRHPEKGNILLEEWRKNLKWEELLAPHTKSKSHSLGTKFFKELTTSDPGNSQTYSVLELVKRIGPQLTLLIHYGGLEDERYYNERILDQNGLESWILQQASDAHCISSIKVPASMDYFNLV